MYLSLIRNFNKQSSHLFFFFFFLEIIFLANLYYWNSSVRLSVCRYPSSAHSFSPISMKLGMDTPWDPAGDMVRFAVRALRYALYGSKINFFFAFLCVSDWDTLFIKNFCKLLKRVIDWRGKKNYYYYFVFLYVSEYFESIETHFFFSKIFVSAKPRERSHWVATQY